MAIDLTAIKPAHRTSWRTRDILIGVLVGAILGFQVSVVFQFSGGNSNLWSRSDSTAEKKAASDTFFPVNEHKDVFFQARKPVHASTTPEDALARSSQIKMKLIEAKINRVGTGRKFLVCTAPKTGATSRNYFWLFINLGRHFPPETIKRDPGLIYRQKVETPEGPRPWGAIPWTYNKTEEEKLHLASETDHVVIVRNPYIRFLSSYKDWLHRNKFNESAYPFRRFTNLYEKAKTNGVTLQEFKTSPIDHVETISSYCKVNDANFIILRLEQQSLWFDQFLRRYQLEETMANYTSTGNLVFASGLKANALLKDHISQIAGKEQWPSALWESSHHRNSADQLAKYYTPAIAKQVTLLQFDDLMNFGYPLWDGIPENFRLV